MVVLSARVLLNGAYPQRVSGLYSPIDAIALSVLRVGLLEIAVLRWVVNSIQG